MNSRNNECTLHLSIYLIWNSLYISRHKNENIWIIKILSDARYLLSKIDISSFYYFNQSIIDWRALSRKGLKWQNKLLQWKSLKYVNYLYDSLFEISYRKLGRTLNLIFIHRFKIDSNLVIPHSVNAILKFKKDDASHSVLHNFCICLNMILQNIIALGFICDNTLKGCTCNNWGRILNNCNRKPF